MQHLYICRHGQSLLNAQQSYAGQLDTPLTDKGRKQAGHAGIQASDLKIDMIIASPLSRAHETAQIIATAIGYPASEILVNDVFKERRWGELEGQPWSIDPGDPITFAGVESAEELNKRAEAGLAFLREQPAENILLVSHGSYLTALRSLIDPDYGEEEPLNALIVQLI